MKSKMFLFVALVIITSVAFGGEFDKIIQSFDAELDTNATGYNASQLYLEASDNNNPDSGYTRLTWIESTVFEGTKALRWEYSVQNAESWGGYQKLGFSLADSTKSYDFTGYDTLSLRYYVEAACSEAGRIEFRVNLADVAEAAHGDTANGNGDAEYYYSMHPGLLDSEPGWNEVKIAIEDQQSWDGAAFNLTGWAGLNKNMVIDKNHIKSVDFELSISGAGEGDRRTGVIILDRLALTGASTVDLTIFNGKSFPATVTLEQPWSGSVEVTDEEDAAPEGGTNSIKWNAGAQWAGPIFRLANPQNMQFSWVTDSVQFKAKAEAGAGGLQIKFADVDEGDGDFPFEAIYDFTAEEMAWDGTWKIYKVALADFNRFAGVWVTDHTEHGEMDSSKVAMFAIITNDGNSDGKTIYLDDIWSGNPTFDLFAPVAPAGVSATPYPSQYYNLVMWQDVGGEDGEVYDVYASPNAIDSVTGPGVEQIASGVLEGTMATTHYLRYPLVDGQVDNYYAVVCKDAAGNVGEAGYSPKVTGTAKGIPTISLDVPDGFVADGYFDEWYDSGIMPWVLKPEVNNVAVGSFTDSTDLKATIWIAIDDDFLYVAGDIVDDFYNYGEGDWWNQDAFEFFIGLYNQVGSPHTANKRGGEPDYKLQFKEPGLESEYKGNMTWANGSDYFYLEGFNPDYVFEAKISLDSLAGTEDARFHPVRGMKIPIELYMHDNDGTPNTMEGALAWSSKNEDNAWQSPAVWAYTWIGDTVAVGIEDNENVATTFNLAQNYPNPFNPTTTINYSIAKQEMVKINLYNVLGQKVVQLVNKNQRAGAYNIKWNATNYSSGIYFYRIEAGDFVRTKKMLLVK